MKICPVCQAQLDDAVNVCPRCGTVLPAQQPVQQPTGQPVGQQPVHPPYPPQPPYGMPYQQPYAVPIPDPADTRRSSIPPTFARTSCMRS